MKRLNEQKLNLEIEWWDDCISTVMTDLKDECNGILDYETLLHYVKCKYQILGRQEPGYNEALLLEHIKDLIFQHYGDSIYSTGTCNWDENNTAEVQAKGFVVGELGNTILDKVLSTIKTDDDPIPGITSVSLVDKEFRKLIPMKPVQSDNCEDEYCEDLPYEYESHKRPVKGFNDFSKKLNETVGVIEITCQEKCIQYCLDRIKKEVGNYDPDEIFKVAGQAADPKVKARMVLLYVKDMVIDYLSNEKAQLAVVDVNGKKGKNIPKDILEQGLDQLYQDIADEVLVKIANINGISLSDGEVE